MITRRDFLAQAGVSTAAWLAGPRRQEKKPLAATESNIEGPFYRKGAPFRTKLAEGLKGDALAISGKVLAPDGTPLRDAVVDVWQADKEGAYDNTSDKFVLRGRIRTDKDGLYAYETILPGQYDLGEAKRPAHIHYKISAEGHRPLTTQLYFKGDPWLERDPFVRQSLIIELSNAKGVFDIVLARA
jgi:catechol 1,2-dioxygenase